MRWAISKVNLVRYIDLCASNSVDLVGSAGVLLRFRYYYDTQYVKQIQLVEFSDKFDGNTRVKYTTHKKEAIEKLVKDLWNMEISLQV